MLDLVYVCVCVCVNKLPFIRMDIQFKIVYNFESVIVPFSICGWKLSDDENFPTISYMDFPLKNHIYNVPSSMPIITKSTKKLEVKKRRSGIWPLQCMWYMERTQLIHTISKQTNKISNNVIEIAFANDCHWITTTNNVQCSVHWTWHGEHHTLGNLYLILNHSSISFRVYASGSSPFWALLLTLCLGS